MRLLIRSIALAIAITVAPATAQEQKTLGPCSPAIAGVNGNVTVTCITGERRIRIAKYNGSFDKDGCRKLASFAEDNLGQIIHVDAYTNMDRKLYEPPTKNGDFGYLYCKDHPRCGEECQTAGVSCKAAYCDGTEINFDGVNKTGSVYFEHANWIFRGYFLVAYTGIHTGILEYTLRSIDDKEILLSDKYDTR